MTFRTFTPCLVVLFVACSDAQRAPLPTAADGGQLEQLEGGRLAMQPTNAGGQKSVAFDAGAVPPMAGADAPTPEPDAGAESGGAPIALDSGTPEPEPEPDAGAESDGGPNTPRDSGTPEPEPEPCHEAAGAQCGQSYIRCALCDGSQWMDLYPRVSCAGLCVDPSGCPGAVDGWGPWNAAARCYEVTP